VSLALYDEGLRSPEVRISVRYQDGRHAPLDLDRWRGAVTRADESMLLRASGSVLDVGCGPGRLTAALAARGVDALGIDVAAAAVALTLDGGGRALQRSVFDPLPGTGGWGTALLADGNIGIGGNPVRLLRRIADLLTPDGQVLTELDPPGTGPAVRLLARLETSCGRSGAWFGWAVVGVDALPAVAAEAGLSIGEVWSAPEPGVGPRFFAALRPQRRQVAD
jgi:SAM-dependent methyltransferase